MEQSYKEKYEQALAKAKEQYNYPCMRSCMGILEEIFPELAESEDEKVRNGLVRLLKELLELGGVAEDEWDRNECEKYIAWLEKQAEQKPNPVLDIEIPFGAKDSELQEATYYIPKGFHAEIDDDKVVIKQGEHKPQRMISAEAKEALFDYENANIQQKDFAPKIEPKFNVGDKIYLKPEYRMPDDDTPIANTVKEIRRIDDKHYRFNGSYIFIEDQDKYELVEQNPAWSEEDEHRLNSCLNILQPKTFVGNTETINTKWLKSLKDRVQPQPKQGEQNLVLRDTFGYEDGRLFGMNEGIGLVLDNPEKYGLQKPVKWSKEDENVISLILSICNDFLESFEISPASTKVVKEDVDKIKNWLQSLQDRVQPQPKQEWSEEDEEILRTILSDGIRGAELDMLQVNWLKSLRPQNHWKPNDEQIKVCKEVYADILSAKGFDLGTVNSELNRLEEELKKLKEE